MTVYILILNKNGPYNLGYSGYSTGHQVPNKKQESWSRHDLLLENGRVPHKLQCNASRKYYFAVNIKPAFFTVRFLVLNRSPVP